MNNSALQGKAISLKDVSKSWAGTKAVDQIDVDVEPGTFTVLLGPSGCGKSTSLRIIAGLESADNGEISIGGQNVNHLPPSRRDIAMVFQSYALFPHLNVAENILFGLKVRRTPKSEQAQRLKQTADLLGLSAFLDRKPSQLSGGQQQRVALGRAIIAEKPICLMDEPLSNLDAKLRNSMRMEIRDLQQSLGFSMVYVTHDQAEAITMADQLVLMKDGRVEQCGSPRQLYEQPQTAFVASFIGTPPMNLVEAEDVLAATVSNTSMAGQLRAAAASLCIGIRPEQVRISEGAGIRANVEHVEYLGADLLANCRVGSSNLLARLEGHSSLKPNTQVTLSWPAEHTHYFDSVSGARQLQVPEGLAPLFSH